MELETNININSTSSSEGVVLFAFGNICYYQAVYNLVNSIKYYSPNIKIALFVEDINKCIGATGDIMNYVDTISQIENSDLYVNGKLDPAMLKVSIYKYLPFRNNLYLDVDAVCLKDIQPLIDEMIKTKRHYISHCLGYHTIDLGRDIPSMVWAWADDVWQHFKLDHDAILPSINSSIQFIKKSKKAKDLFGVLRILYTTNQLPLKKLKSKWGGGQPDELYMNVALAMTSYDPSYKNGNNIDGSNSLSGLIHFASKRSLSFQEVIDNYYFQSYYGGQNYTSRFYTEWLDRLLKGIMKMQNKTHQFYINRIILHKYVNK